MSSKPVVRCADDVVRKILDSYLEPDKSFAELREMVIDGTIDVARLQRYVPRRIRRNATNTLLSLPRERWANAIAEASV